VPAIHLLKQHAVLVDYLFELLGVPSLYSLHFARDIFYVLLGSQVLALLLEVRREVILNQKTNNEAD
jgi:hypothetical protein